MEKNNNATLQECKTYISSKIKRELTKKETEDIEQTYGRLALETAIEGKTHHLASAGKTEIYEEVYLRFKEQKR